ncbi:RNA polymerase sigma-70 factor, ECF subfamily [Alteribacillus persepolensis]|uniref:RNA polymerase sigma-70 factor, ECF subfamily n=1 Tax=Alteribacillus persepolensis TaxID=568899 RepID=A0A1G8JNP5_9BACI|nr:sigma-70 family RNA polymerase sigma factor [Alteribacillus persepolensis]SDI32703.1 RNA polymerase sigma-70 factor, ECF subfamily [Alteribacillus persepolensis]
MEVVKRGMNQERRWIKAIQKRSSEEAANRLIRKYYQEIYAFVFKQTFDQELAKDLTQEIFVSMLRSIFRYDGRASFRTWLYKIANSRIIDYYRSKFYKENKHAPIISEELLEEPEDFVVDIERKEEAQSVLNVLARFGQQHQQIVRQKIYAEQTFAEIADSLSIPESTVKSQYYAAIKRLRKELGGEK